MDLINEVKKKKEFLGLPDSVVIRVVGEVDESLDSKTKVKEVRAILRKYFGVFLTNKVVKPKDIMDYDSILKSHKSSGKREYDEFYGQIRKCFRGEEVVSIIDFGAGGNGFSYPYLRKAFGNVRYVGVEASGQLVDNTNVFFDKSGFGKLCEVVHGDLFDVNFVEGILKSEGKGRVVFLFQVIDALESLEKNFSKDFLLKIKRSSEHIVVSMPMLSLSGKMIKVKRDWVVGFLKGNFEVLGEFEKNGEIVFCLKC